MNDTQSPGRLDRVLAVAVKLAQPPKVSGKVLRLERQAAFVTVTALARDANLPSRQRLQAWERREVTPEQAARYLAALAVLTAKGRDA